MWGWTSGCGMSRRAAGSPNSAAIRALVMLPPALQTTLGAAGGAAGHRRSRCRSRGRSDLALGRASRAGPLRRRGAGDWVTSPRWPFRWPPHRRPTNRAPCKRWRATSSPSITDGSTPLARRLGRFARFLRVGARVDYMLSSDDHYQNAPNAGWMCNRKHQLPPHVSTKLAALPTVPKDGSPLTCLAAPIRFADRVIEQCAQRRRSNSVRTSPRRGTRSLSASRPTTAMRFATDRASAARKQTRLPLGAAGRTRRQCTQRACHGGFSEDSGEVTQASHEVRPYRLHIYEVPVWRFAGRRPPRATACYPLTLDWLIPLNPFRRRRLPTLRCR